MQEAAEQFEIEQATEQAIAAVTQQGPRNRHPTGKERRQAAFIRSLQTRTKPEVYGPRSPLREVRRELQENGE